MLYSARSKPPWFTILEISKVKSFCSWWFISWLFAAYLPGRICWSDGLREWYGKRIFEPLDFGLGGSSKQLVPEKEHFADPSPEEKRRDRGREALSRELSQTIEGKWVRMSSECWKYLWSVCHASRSSFKKSMYVGAGLHAIAFSMFQKVITINHGNSSWNRFLSTGMCNGIFSPEMRRYVIRIREIFVS